MAEREVIEWQVPYGVIELEDDNLHMKAWHEKPRYRGWIENGRFYCEMIKDAEDKPDNH